MATFASTLSSNPTPFGIFDSDRHFQSDADSMVTFVKRKLGDDILSVELSKKQIWACFEESTLEYSKAINQHQAESYISNLMGYSTGSEDSHYMTNSSGKYIDKSGTEILFANNSDNTEFNPLSNLFGFSSGNAGSRTKLQAVPTGPNGKEQKFPLETLDYLVRRAQPYATEAAVGGSFNMFSGSIDLKQNVQDYNIYETLKDSEGNLVYNNLDKSASGGENQQTKLRLFEVFHFSPQAAYRFFDTTSAINYLNNQFAFESFTPETVFYVLPVFEDILRAGQLDISNRVRRSNYSYEIVGQNLRIFPRPTQDNPRKLFIRYYSAGDPFQPSYDTDVTIDGVSNYSNLPFGNLSYSKINSMARTWIWQYTLALSKELLGHIRSKFSSVPIPGSDLQLNGSDLLSQGREDKENLKTELKELLEKMTYLSIIESDATESEHIQNILKRVPIPNGKCIVMG